MPQDGPDYAALYESMKAERDALQTKYDGLVADIQAVISKYRG